MQDALTTYFTGEKNTGLVLATQGLIGLAALAAMTALVLKRRVTISGIAFGLLVNAALLLAFDVIAEGRGATYLATLEARAGQTAREAP